MPNRIIVGPTQMRVERCGFTSPVAVISDEDSIDDIKVHAKALLRTIKLLILHHIWAEHRFKMAAQRRLVSRVHALCPGPYYAGPNPGDVSTKPWSDATSDYRIHLPHGVAARLLRESGAE